VRKQLKEKASSGERKVIVMMVHELPLLSPSALHTHTINLYINEILPSRSPFHLQYKKIQVFVSLEAIFRSKISRKCSILANVLKIMELTILQGELKITCVTQREEIKSLNSRLDD
jgi:hypothetical protein